MSFVKLYRTIFDDTEFEYTEEVFFKENWLAAHVEQSLPEFLETYTSDEVDMLMGDAILENAIPFTFSANRDKLFVFYALDEDAVLQFVDCISEMLNVKHPGASKAIDVVFEL